MANYTNENLIKIDPNKAPAGVLAIKIGSDVFMAGDVNIEGTDVSDTTATAEDVKEGKQFYNADGVLTDGTNTDVNVSATTATAEDVLEGKQFYNAEGALTQGTYVPAPSGGSAEYFKCVAVGEKVEEPDTPTEPDFPQSTALPEEYLLVSGCSVSDANGVYKLKDRNAVGYERQWAKMSGGATFLGDAENGCYALMYDGGATMMVILSGDSPIGSYTDNLPNGTENGVVVTQYEEEYVYQFNIEGEAGNPSCLGEYTLEDTSTMAVWRKWVNSNEKAYVNWATDRWYIYTTDEGWNMPCYQSSITTADVPPTDSSLTWTTAAGTAPIPTISPVGTSGDSSSSGNSTDIIVSGAVVSGTNGDPNGTYSLIDPEKTGKERQWRNESGCWIIWETYSDEDDAPGFWSLRDVDPDEEMTDIYPGEWIFVGSDQYEGTAESPIDETWKNGNYDGYGDTLPTFKWASAEPETPVLPANTWNGQKAILLTDEETGKPYYEFEETVTEGLTYGNGFTPAVDGIYDREALVKAELSVKYVSPISSPENMTDYENDEWVISASSEYEANSAWKAFDGNSDTAWWGNTTPVPKYLQWQKKGGQVLVKYLKIVSEEYGYYDMDSADFRFQGSNDGEVWTDIIVGNLANQSTVTSEPFGRTYEVTIPDNNTAYTYHRLYCSYDTGGYWMVHDLIAKSIIE